MHGDDAVQHGRDGREAVHEACQHVGEGIGIAPFSAVVERLAQAGTIPKRFLQASVSSIWEWTLTRAAERMASAS